jgi:hypothetical protein
VRRPAKHAAEPLQIEHEAVHREAIRAQRAELVLELGPVVEPELRHPETERLLGGHGRSAHEAHVPAVECDGCGSGEQISADRVARHRHPPRIAGGIPCLRVELIEEQGIALADATEGIQDRELCVLGEPAAERSERIAHLATWRDELAEQITVGLARREEVLPEAVDVPHGRACHREDVAITAHGLVAERGHARRRLARPIGHVQAQPRGVDSEAEHARIPGSGLDGTPRARASRAQDHRRRGDPCVRARRSRLRPEFEVDQPVVEDLDGQTRVVGNDLERGHLMRGRGPGCGDDEGERRDERAVGEHARRLP